MAVNTVNNKIYIGQTMYTIERRKSRHRSQVDEGSMTHFHRSWRKYGEHVFEWDILEEIPKEELNNAEIFWIAYFKYIGAGLYNHTIGGAGVNGYKHGEEQLRKMSEAHKGKEVWNKGKKCNPATESRKEKIRQALLGRALSEERKQKISRANKGKLKGRCLSEETKQKMKEAQQLRRSNEKR